jgi:hypothetical protein
MLSEQTLFFRKKTSLSLLLMHEEKGCLVNDFHYEAEVCASTIFGAGAPRFGTGTI